MATYYAPRRARAVSQASTSLSNGGNGLTETKERQERQERQDGLHSIYIFPSPASAPPSPAVSVSSAPTDFDFSSPISSRSTSCTRPPQRDSAQADVRGARRSSVSAAYDASSRYWDLPNPPGNDLEINLSLWDIASDVTTEPSDSDESWALEGEVERVGFAEVDLLYTPHWRRTRQAPLSSSQSRDGTRPRYRFSARPRQRSRPRSRIRTTSISSLALSSTQQTVAPHPRINVPLLSFFASLLSLDLEDSALRLLTNAESGDAEAVLFPGQSSARLLAQVAEQPTDRRSSDSDSDTETESTATGELPPYDLKEETHGLPKMLLASISDQSTVALRSLRSGFAVRLPAAASELLPLPRATELIELWRVFGQVCSRGSQAWKETWAAALSTGRSVK
ncbi:hypothetical protein TRAPUB_9480 [Trametes pubescens]|uniref:Uncharacterized protein n=1 Tax=Trametes pubescens TaxID=154538 RepID=A0A1M2W2G2_TRAPU|nr:hypothetical protein TRAPUB_9480 [Trametes pubescens]